MVAVLFAVGLLATVLVGVAVGWASGDDAFGAGLESGAITSLWAGALLTVFALAGAITVGRPVVATMGGGLVPVGFSLAEAVVLLVWIGGAMALAVLARMPASASITAVGAIVGLGLARDTLEWATLGFVAVWWLISPVVAFWLSAAAGRYLYPRLVDRVAVHRSSAPLLRLDTTGSVPAPTLNRQTTPQAFAGTAALVVTGCFLAFAAGASNVASVAAPLIGSGDLAMTRAILLGGLAMGAGGFAVAWSRFGGVGPALADVPLLAVVLAGVVTATIVTILATAGVPGSVVVVGIASLVGLGWGRATAGRRLGEVVRNPPPVSVGALAEDGAATVAGDDRSLATTTAGTTGTTDGSTVPSAEHLFARGTGIRAVAVWTVVPAVATVGSYLAFTVGPLA